MNEEGNGETVQIGGVWGPVSKGIGPMEQRSGWILG